MSHQGIDVDQLDLGANSPLHLAAKEGHTSSVASLLNFGAMVSLKVLIYYINIHNMLKKLRGSTDSTRNHFKFNFLKKFV